MIYDGQQDAEPLGYTPLSANIVTKSEGQIRTMTQRGMVRGSDRGRRATPGMAALWNVANVEERRDIVMQILEPVGYTHQYRLGRGI
jgi:hypothetical protein